MNEVAHFLTAAFSISWKKHICKHLHQNQNTVLIPSGKCGKFGFADIRPICLFVYFWESAS